VEYALLLCVRTNIRSQLSCKALRTGWGMWGMNFASKQLALSGRQHQSSGVYALISLKVILTVSSAILLVFIDEAVQLVLYLYFEGLILKGMGVGPFLSTHQHQSTNPYLHMQALGTLVETLWLVIYGIFYRLGNTLLEYSNGSVVVQCEQCHGRNDHHTLRCITSVTVQLVSKGGSENIWVVEGIRTDVKGVKTLCSFTTSLLSSRMTLSV